MAPVRVVGPILGLLGGAAVVLGAVQFRSAEGNLAIWMMGGGFAALAAGFAALMRKRGEIGRPAAAFNLHVGLMAGVAVALYFWLRGGGDLRVAAALTATLAAQILGGGVLGVIAAFSGHRVGAVFFLTAAAYLACLAGGAFVAVRAL